LAALDEIATELRRMISTPLRSATRLIVKARAIDERLHDLIASSSGNALLASEIGRLKTLFRAYRDLAWDHHAKRNDYHRLAGEAHEHLAIVDALLAGDRTAAARAMSKHIRSGLKYWSRALPASRPEAAVAQPKQNGRTVATRRSGTRRSRTRRSAPGMAGN
jgi:DNA-binding GntR family transcriptional regulator